VGNGDVLDIVVHKNIRLSNVIVSDILASDHLPIIFHIPDHVRTKTISTPLEKITDWELFQSLTSNLISPRIEINSGAEAHKAALALTASIASAYRLSTSKITLSELNNDLPGLDRLSKYKKKMRKLWQETRDPGCKKTVNWVSKSIGRMTRKKALERWETKLAPDGRFPHSARTQDVGAGPPARGKTAMWEFPHIIYIYQGTKAHTIVEVGQITSTIALRVVRDEKRS
jgi:hypothetical protein